MQEKPEMIKYILAIIALFSVSDISAKEIDLSNRTDASGSYNVAFCARDSPTPDGKPGHAFVAFSHQFPDGSRDFLSIGLTVGADVSPAKAIWSYFGAPVQGLLKEEQYTAISQNCLDVTVNKEDFNAAKQFSTDPLSKLGLTFTSGSVLESYKLGSGDCMGFLIQVANSLKHAGLVVPSRGAVELPQQYVQRLIQAN
jgi:hypothetical protein